jgi:hypothetical protein
MKLKNTFSHYYSTRVLHYFKNYNLQKSYSPFSTSYTSLNIVYELVFKMYNMPLQPVNMVVMSTIKQIQVIIIKYVSKTCNL